MEDYKQYTIAAIGISLLFILVTVVYLLFFKSDPLFAFQDWLGQ
ncbi:MAG: hypothetical protein ACFFCM_16600 [Promethearchaeota archaeon]